jgi:hypothetical protein
MRTALLLVALLVACVSAQKVLDLSADNFDEAMTQHPKMLVEVPVAFICSC